MNHRPGATTPRWSTDAWQAQIAAEFRKNGARETKAELHVLRSMRITECC